MRFRRLPRRTDSRQGARTRAGPREPPRTPSMHRRGDLRRRERHSRALSRGGGHLTVKYVKHSMRARCGKLGPSSNEKLAGGREPISSRRLPATATARPPPSSLPEPVYLRALLSRIRAHVLHAAPPSRVAPGDLSCVKPSRSKVPGSESRLPPSGDDGRRNFTSRVFSG